jgi:hypothetical protein
MAGEKLAGTPERPAVEAPAEADASVARLDEIRASLGKEKNAGDTTAAG